MITNNTIFRDEVLQITIDKISNFAAMFNISPIHLADVIESRDIKRFVECGILTGKDRKYYGEIKKCTTKTATHQKD